MSFVPARHDGLLLRGLQRGVQGRPQGAGAVQQAADQDGGGRAEGVAVEGAAREDDTITSQFVPTARQ